MSFGHPIIGNPRFLLITSLRLASCAAGCCNRVRVTHTIRTYLAACLLFLFTIRLRLNDHRAIAMIAIGPEYAKESTGVAEFVNRNSKQAAGLRRMRDSHSIAAAAHEAR